MARKKTAKKAAKRAVKKKATGTGGGSRRWRAAAMKLPETEEGSSCNNSSFKARGKAFLYLGEREDGSFKVMVKLTDSRAEAEKMSKADPDRVSVGPHWITAYFEQDRKLPAGLPERWVEESFRALAPKKLVAEYDGK